MFVESSKSSAGSFETTFWEDLKASDDVSKISVESSEAFKGKPKKIG